MHKVASFGPEASFVAEMIRVVRQGADRLDSVDCDAGGGLAIEAR